MKKVLLKTFTRNLSLLLVLVGYVLSLWLLFQPWSSTEIISDFTGTSKITTYYGFLLPEGQIFIVAETVLVFAFVLLHLFGPKNRKKVFLPTIMVVVAFFCHMIPMNGETYKGIDFIYLLLSPPEIIFILAALIEIIPALKQIKMPKIKVK